MTNYRRAYQPGGCYFFTVVTFERRAILAQPRVLERLRAAFVRTREKMPFTMDAVVILPDHLHTVWRLPADDRDFSSRWQSIKRYVSAGIAADGAPSASHEKKREKSVWQRRFWEHLIRDEADWRRHVDYVHYNPVKHGYAASPAHWPHSSFRRAVERGWYHPAWGAQEPDNVKGLDFE